MAFITMTPQTLTPSRRPLTSLDLASLENEVQSSQHNLKSPRTDGYTGTPASKKMISQVRTPQHIAKSPEASMWESEWELEIFQDAEDTTTEELLQWAYSEIDSESGADEDSEEQTYYSDWTSSFPEKHGSPKKTPKFSRILNRITGMVEEFWESERGALSRVSGMLHRVVVVESCPNILKEVIKQPPDFRDFHDNPDGEGYCYGIFDSGLDMSPTLHRRWEL